MPHHALLASSRGWSDSNWEQSLQVPKRGRKPRAGTACGEVAGDGCLMALDSSCPSFKVFLLARVPVLQPGAVQQFWWTGPEGMRLKAAPLPSPRKDHRAQVWPGRAPWPRESLALCLAVRREPRGGFPSESVWEPMGAWAVAALGTEMWAVPQGLGWPAAPGPSPTILPGQHWGSVLGALTSQSVNKPSEEHGDIVVSRLGRPRPCVLGFKIKSFPDQVRVGPARGSEGLQAVVRELGGRSRGRP